MKVEEAKTKVCPFIMGSGSINFDEPISNNDVTANINCICGDCMAWVCTKDTERKNRKDIAWDKPLQEDEKEGYCKRLGV